MAEVLHYSEKHRNALFTQFGKRSTKVAITRINKGAAVLDKHMPGWVNKITLEKLDLSDGLSCISGQLFYREAIHRLDKEAMPPEFRGENYPHQLGLDSSDQVGYDVLNRLWSDLIERRIQRKRLVYIEV